MNMMMMIMKIRPVGGELSLADKHTEERADRQTDRQT